MKLAVVGTRYFNAPQFMYRILGERFPGITGIVSGGARGADTFGGFYAARNKIPLTVFPAKWNEFGPSAGFRRNLSIVEACDEVAAFWDGSSPGTAHTIKVANRASKPVHIFWPPPGWKE